MAKNAVAVQPLRTLVAAPAFLLTFCRPSVPGAEDEAVPVRLLPPAENAPPGRNGSPLEKGGHEVASSSRSGELEEHRA